MIIEELIALLGFDLEGEGDLKRFADGIQSAEKNAQRAAKSIGILGVAVGSFIGSMAAQAFTRLSSTIGSLPGDVTKTGATFENLGIRLETLEGSADKAKVALAWVQQFAKDTPLGLADTADAYAQLKNYGIDPTNGSLMALTDAMAASGKGTQQLGRLSLALGQAWVKQKLQGGEILQLTEAGIPVWDMLATATGKNVAELQKLSQAGKLGRTEIQLLINEIGRKYAGASEKMARTYDGLIDKLGDAYQQFQLMISDAGWFDFVKKNLDELEKKFSDFLETDDAKQWARTISNVMIGAAQAAMRFGRAVLRVGRWIGKGFDEIGKTIADGLRSLTGGSVDLSNMQALAFAGALLFAVFSPLAAAIVASALALDDFLAYMEGGPSAIGALIDKLPELTAAFDKIAPGVRGAVSDAIAALQGGDWRGAGVLAVEAFQGGWSALHAGLQPYIDQALAYLSSVDWIGAINRGLTSAVAATNSINWGDVGAEGGKLGVQIGAALVVALVAELQGASHLLGKAVKDGLMNVSWSGVGSLIVSSLKAQFDLLTGIVSGISQQIIAMVGGWFNIDLTGAGARLASTLLEGLKSIGPAIREWFDSLLPGWAQGFVADLRANDRRTAAGDAGDRVGAMVPPKTGTGPRVTDAATNRVNQAFAGGPANDNPALADALQRIAAGLAAVNGDNAGQKVQETVANDNRVLNQSNTVNAPVTVNATLTNTTPGAIGAAAGAGVRSAGNSAVRSLAVTGLPSFGGPR